MGIKACKTDSEIISFKVIKVCGRINDREISTPIFYHMQKRFRKCFAICGTPN